MAQVFERFALAVALLVIVSGCETSESSSDAPPRNQADATRGVDSGPTEEPVLAPELQHLPSDWSEINWSRSRQVRAPAGDTALPMVLDGGPPARLAYHPVERLTDPEGWAGERIFFLGRDGQWRELDMGDLGLPDTWWPGSDTFGPGSLSADGHTWAAHTNGGVVFVDLTTGASHHVAFPQASPMVRYVTWVPGKNVVSAYARKPEGTRYSTFQLRPNGPVSPVSYDGSRTHFDVDGTPVEVTTHGRTLTLTRGEAGRSTPTQWQLPIRFVRGDPYGVFGQDEVAIQPTLTDTRPVTVWVFDKATGHPQARLLLPPRTSIERWTDSGSLVLYVENRRLVTWDPQSGQFTRLLEVPGPYPQLGEWAASTVSLASD